MRIALLPDGTLAIDRSGRVPGRGAWIRPEREMFEQLARKPGVLIRALHLEPPTPPAVEHLLDEARASTLAQFSDLLSLAARSGCLHSGADSVESLVRSGKALALLVATDASPQSLSKARGDRPDLPCFTVPFDKESLGHRIGKGGRALVAISAGGPARALIEQLRRMDCLR